VKLLPLLFQARDLAFAGGKLGFESRNVAGLSGKIGPKAPVFASREAELDFELRNMACLGGKLGPSQAVLDVRIFVRGIRYREINLGSAIHDFAAQRTRLPSLGRCRNP
jgi:hypothetical protein